MKKSDSNGKIKKKKERKERKVFSLGTNLNAHEKYYQVIFTIKNCFRSLWMALWPLWRRNLSQRTFSCQKKRCSNSFFCFVCFLPSVLPAHKKMESLLYCTFLWSQVWPECLMLNHSKSIAAGLKIRYGTISFPPTAWEVRNRDSLTWKA